ncbi:uncharacterized protein LOC128193579 [Vigna angularis]|uniref:uncharacterized protein LOC128193579 n=1 Tax=Phaseolus angularis TaxID=3914 RepID=UPI0022B2BE86|nr:uncharacterized protein LOC128193579 [Vigna angularis]
MRSVFFVVHSHSSSVTPCLAAPVIVLPVVLPASSLHRRASARACRLWLAFLVAPPPVAPPPVAPPPVAPPPVVVPVLAPPLYLHLHPPLQIRRSRSAAPDPPLQIRRSRSTAPDHRRCLSTASPLRPQRHRCCLPAVVSVAAMSRCPGLLDLVLGILFGSRDIGNTIFK